MGQEIPDAELVARALRRLIAEEGEAKAIQLLGLSRSVAARIYGCMPVRQATLLVAAARLGVDIRGGLHLDAADSRVAR
ncbi:MAG TPA: hypothetical protein VFG23_16000 [Polyangia bacterium]|nr:hypothetical protein [Polyangia bacterium]